MTLPDERYRAIRQAEVFMRDLCNAKATPRIPSHIRRRAAVVLKHFPGEYDLDRLAEKSPNVIIKQMEPLTRMVMTYERSNNDDAS